MGIVKPKIWQSVDDHLKGWQLHNIPDGTFFSFGSCENEY
jgi:hypothetical protein